MLSYEVEVRSPSEDGATAILDEKPTLAVYSTTNVYSHIPSTPMTPPYLHLPQCTHSVAQCTEVPSPEVRAACVEALPHHVQRVYLSSSRDDPQV